MQKKYDLSEFSPKENKSSYDLSEFSPKENTVTKAAFNIGKDILNIDPLINIAKDVGSVIKGIPKAATGAITNIPQYQEYLQKNIPEAGNQIMNDPNRTGRNAVAGGAELGGKISRIPNALADYMAKIGMIKPEHAAAMPRPFNEEEVKQWGNKYVGGEQQPGDSLIRGSIRNADALYGAAKLAQVANPMRYTKQNIANNVMRSEQTQIGRHTNAYNNLWERADRAGINNVNYNPQAINMNAIRNFPNDEFHLSVERFLQNPTLNNAHLAQSDLGKMSRQMRRNPTLVQPAEARVTRNAINEAQRHIRDNMFRDANGRMNRSLNNRYNTISHSYGRNVIPYTTNKALQAFKAEDATLPELIAGLGRGRFARRKGGAHPEIGIRKALTENFGNKLGLIGLGSSAYALIDKLLNGK